MADIVSATVPPVSIASPQPCRTAGAGTMGAEFAVRLGEADAAPPSNVTISNTGAANPVLLHQLAVESEEAHDREAHRHGRKVLDLLAELHRAVLRNRQDADLLDRLAGLVDRPPQASSPALAGLTAAIVLRARIELARREAPSSPQD